MLQFGAEFPKKQSYRIGEVAYVLGVHAGTVRRWMDVGKLSGIRMGTQRRIPLESLQGFVKRYPREAI